ncbi:hypothetical protein AB1Y20_017266 [Prymnesium parvum]|uniref:Probable beta-glucosidase G n=1 Tax=Prymnesium parvum TaxID=97485 RepID=A0AB34JMQ7_PRYPA
MRAAAQESLNPRGARTRPPPRGFRPVAPAALDEALEMIDGAAPPPPHRSGTSFARSCGFKAHCLLALLGAALLALLLLEPARARAEPLSAANTASLAPSPSSLPLPLSSEAIHPSSLPLPLSSEAVHPSSLPSLPSSEAIHPSSLPSPLSSNVTHPSSLASPLASNVTQPSAVPSPLSSEATHPSAVPSPLSSEAPPATHPSTPRGGAPFASHAPPPRRSHPPPPPPLPPPPPPSPPHTELAQGYLSSAGAPTPPLSARPAAPPRLNLVEEAAAGVGVWGGSCTCPDGQQYQVGDHADFCATLACVGGVSGECQRDATGPWAGRRVVCAAPPGPLWRRWGESAQLAAAAVAAELTVEEAASLVQGVGWEGYALREGYYVGSIGAIDRLGLPSINMQDAAAGFRTLDDRQVGEVTSWPCALALAATWDPRLSRELGHALGREFRAKGSNVILGPSVNVHRVAHNGRNAEYLSGEEPSLGAVLTAEYVRGVQAEGVAAVVKHFVLNSQETNRNTQSSDIDDRTLWEVYYPPFVAAVEAGVASVMCGYNRVNGQHACGNHKILVEDLKGRMGFEGWVMSDWWAVHASSAASHGVDQEMPGTGYFAPPKLLAAGADVRAMARRVLAGMFGAAAYAQPECSVGRDCWAPLYAADATSAAHDALARRLAASSAVLLKNERRALPLRAGATVALLGACDARHGMAPSSSAWDAADYYVIGGSGRVISRKARSVRQALAARGVRLLPAPAAGVPAALAALRRADVGVVCGGGATREGADRPSLRLDQDDFIRTLAAATRPADPPLVVAAFCPGAVAMEWHGGVAAAVAIFLAGQAHGDAWADVLLGDVNPSGKLPLTFPLDERHVVRPCAAERCAYAEGLAVGWRALHGKRVAFPFGHGMSYTAFNYSWAAPPPRGLAVPRAAAGRGGVARGGGEALSLAVRVRNVGGASGAEVAQLYVAFPPAAGEPPLVLRAFAKTALLPPGEAGVVSLRLWPRDLAVWSAGAWTLAEGHFGLRVGASSRDIRLSHDLHLEAVG